MSHFLGGKTDSKQVLEKPRAKFHLCVVPDHTQARVKPSAKSQALSLQVRVSHEELCLVTEHTGETEAQC